MVTLPQSLKDFLANEEVCVLAVAMPEGEVHAAPLLFWCDMEDLRVYMCTSRTSEKMWWWREERMLVQAALTCGLAKQLPYSLQMRGKLEEFDPASDPRVTDQYRRIASDLDNPDDPDNIMIVFTPHWARYTDRANGYTRHQLTISP